jgi:hypothetical protein
LVFALFAGGSCGNEARCPLHHEVRRSLFSRPGARGRGRLQAYPHSSWKRA